MIDKLYEVAYDGGVVLRVTGDAPVRVTFPSFRVCGEATTVSVYDEVSDMCGRVFKPEVTCEVYIDNEWLMVDAINVLTTG